MTDVELWRELGQQFRVDSIRTAAAAKSGHPSSGMSAADLMAVLLAKYLRYDFDNPDDLRNDKLVFSKGHASTLLYAIFRAAGAIDDEELLTYRRHGSRLEGHPTPVIPWVDVATGSLGQGLPIGVGMALGAKYLDRMPTRVWVLHGDSEMAEGSVWEAFEHAAHYQLDNLTVILDANRLGQRGETMTGWNLEAYRARAEAFGWHAIVIDGHDVEAIDLAYAEALETVDQPTIVIAKTVKGKGVAAVEDKPGFHGKALDDPDAAIAELGGKRDLKIDVAKPEGDAVPQPVGTVAQLDLPKWQIGEEVATRLAYGEALKAVGAADGKVVALDGEVSNSTYAEIFAKAHPERYFEMFIAEQQLVAAAVGLQTRGWKPFASTFAAFFSRAYDFVRMAAISQADLRLAAPTRASRSARTGPRRWRSRTSPRCGRSTAAPCCTPATPTRPLDSWPRWPSARGSPTCARCGPLRRCCTGRTRTSRSAGARCHAPPTRTRSRSSAAGITVHEALKAADALAEEGVNARVIDLYSIKPLDEATLRDAAEATGGRIVTVEDHWPEGGLGEAVLAAFADAEERPRVKLLAVSGMPHSGKPAELLAAAGIDADHIAQAARELVGAAVRA